MQWPWLTCTWALNNIQIWIMMGLDGHSQICSGSDSLRYIIAVSLSCPWMQMSVFGLAHQHLFDGFDNKWLNIGSGWCRTSWPILAINQYYHDNLKVCCQEDLESKAFIVIIPTSVTVTPALGRACVILEENQLALRDGWNTLPHLNLH